MGVAVVHVGHSLQLKWLNPTTQLRQDSSSRLPHRHLSIACRTPTSVAGRVAVRVPPWNLLSTSPRPWACRLSPTFPTEATIKHVPHTLQQQRAQGTSRTLRTMQMHSKPQLQPRGQCRSLLLLIGVVTVVVCTAEGAKEIVNWIMALSLLDTPKITGWSATVGAPVGERTGTSASRVKTTLCS